MQHRVELLAVIFNGRGSLLIIEGVSPGVKWFLPSGLLNEDESPRDGIARCVQERVRGIWPEEIELRLFNVEKNRPGVISLGYLGLVTETVHFQNPAAGLHRDWRAKLMEADYDLAQRGWAASGLDASIAPSDPVELEEPPALTFRQLQMLRDLYNGVGTQRARNNPTLAALQEKGCVVLQELDNGKHFWQLTELGRSVISA